MHKQRVVMALVALVGMSSAFLPWATSPLFSGSISGIGGMDGKILLAIFALGVLLSVTGERREVFDPGSRAFAMMVGFGGVAWAAWKLRAIHDQTLPVGVGYGIWVMLGAGLAMMAIAFAVKPRPVLATSSSTR